MYDAVWNSQESKGDKRILAVFAHPDDETIQAGGMLLKSAAEGAQTHVLCLTFGAKGWHKPNTKPTMLKRIRAKELSRACNVLGVSGIITPDLPDGELYAHRAAVQKVIRHAIRAIQPDVVITHDPSGSSGHPDHVTTSMCVTELFREQTRNDASYFYSIPPGNSVRIGVLSPTHAIDITPYMVKKYKALSHYKSQIGQETAERPKSDIVALSTEYLHMLHHRKTYDFHLRGYRTKYFLLPPAVDAVFRI